MSNSNIYEDIYICQYFYIFELFIVVSGIPYAEPPVGPFRFSPPRSPQPWRDIRSAQEFAPVCPQVLPNLKLEVKPARHDYLERLLTYLKNQSEDCLYLNIYAPHQVDGKESFSLSYERYYSYKSLHKFNKFKTIHFMVKKLKFLLF